MRLRVAEINQNAVAHIPGDEAAGSGPLDGLPRRTVNPTALGGELALRLPNHRQGMFVNQQIFASFLRGGFMRSLRQHATSPLKSLSRMTAFPEQVRSMGYELQKI
jgi:hypothetical protein